MSSRCEYIHLNGSTCKGKPMQGVPRCKKHINSNVAGKCLGLNCARFTRSRVSLCAKCVNDEKSVHMILTKNIDQERRRKIVDIKNLLVKYSLVHDNPDLSPRAIHELFDKINEFDELYGIPVQGDDLAEYSDIDTLASQVESEFNIDTDEELTDNDSIYS
jgi:hypothetical protein